MGQHYHGRRQAFQSTVQSKRAKSIQYVNVSEDYQAHAHRMSQRHGPILAFRLIDTPVTLSWREVQCVYFLMLGLTVKGTSERIFLSPRTVEFYMNNIKRKLWCRRKADVMVKIAQSNFSVRLLEELTRS